MKTPNGKPLNTLFFSFWLCLLCACSKAPEPQTAAASNDPNDQTQEEVAVNATSVAYICAGNKKLIAVYDHSDPEAMKTIITVEGDNTLQNVELKSVEAASGAKSSNGKIVWWTKEDTGFLANEDAPAGNGKALLSSCKEVPAYE